MNKIKTIENLKKLKEKMPELIKATYGDRFWELFHPYTLEDTIDLLKIEGIEEIKEEALALSSDWNGSDEKFLHNGDVYTEDDAQHAQDIVDKCEELEELLKEE